MPETVAYEKGAATPEQIAQAIPEFFAAIDSDEQIREDAEQAGVDLEALRAAGPDGVDVSKGGLSRVSGGETILIALAIHAGAKAIDEVIVPWLKRRLSRDAVGPKQDDAS